MDTSKYKLKIFGNKELPSYLLEKNNVVRMILFTTVYSLVFINIFRPFNSETWIHDINSTNYAMYSSLMVLIGMVVVSLSRFIMNLVVKKVQLTYPDYIIWLVSDAVIVLTPPSAAYKSLLSFHEAHAVDLTDLLARLGHELHTDLRSALKHLGRDVKRLVLEL